MSLELKDNTDLQCPLDAAADAAFGHIALHSLHAHDHE